MRHSLPEVVRLRLSRFSWIAERAHPVVVQPQQMSQLSHAQFALRRHPDLLVDHRQWSGVPQLPNRGEQTLKP